MKHLFLFLFIAASAAAEQDTARRILETSGVKGGLVVHIGRGDDKLLARVAAAGEIQQRLVDAPFPESSGVWPDSAPADCPFPKSPQFGGVEFTGRHKAYYYADTWYPSWASDGNLYSPFTDGWVNNVQCYSGPQTWKTGNARIEGDDPLSLKVVPLGLHQSPAAPYGGRYPCGSLAHNGLWYYGTYCLDRCKHPWDTMGPFVGFRISRDGGRTWEETPCAPEKPLFGEAIKPFDAQAPLPKGPGPNISVEQYRAMPKIKMGSPHFVDFGKNMGHSPDGKAYLIGHGATRPEATCSWISGDQVYLARVTPSPETINNVNCYEFFAGHDAHGEPVWVKDFARIKPLLEWNDHLGCVTATWNPALKRYLLCVTNGGETGMDTFDTMILESEKITGPWRRVALMEKFGQQAYFVNIPSKFISADGRTMWLCYAANYNLKNGRSIPWGSRYGMCLYEFRLPRPDELKRSKTLKASVPLDTPDNVARTAKATASSHHAHCPPENAINGLVGGAGISMLADEWSAEKESVGAWLRLIWDAPQTVNRVWLFDRPSDKVQVMEAELRFSDGSTIMAGELPDDARQGRQITFPPKTITWLEVRITKTRTTHPFIGLSEIAVFRAGASNTSAQQLLDASGVKGGLVVCVGCDGGKLRATESFVVQNLDKFPGGRLPYADNLVNLLVCDKAQVAEQEILRVLVPNGVALVGGKKIVKPWPKEIDEWTHYLHGPDNNAVAHDRVVATPQRLQWEDKPFWSRSHEYHSSLAAMVSAQGRLFCIFDEGPTGVVDPRIPDKWKLIARDAFNGIVLWKRDIADWGWRAWNPRLESVDWRRMPSQRGALPTAIARRLVAAGDRVYVTLGYQAPVTALDAATGKTLMTYAGTERTDEILYLDGCLVLCIRESLENAAAPAAKKIVTATVAAFEAATGRRLWQTPPGTVTPLSLAIAGKNVFFHNQNGVVCMDAASGKARWRAATSGNAGAVTLVVHEQVVLCVNQKQLVALSVADGKPLWTLPGARGFGISNSPDLFVADGLVWYGHGKPEVETITGYDLLTGKTVRTVTMDSVITRGHHPRCFRSKATDNYLLLSKRGVEFISITGQPHMRNNWVRGACRYGVVPCNGLLYSTPNPCFCYAGVKMGGFLALAPGGTETPIGERLERGSAYSTTHHSPLTNSDWPMYRHDAKRSGSTTTTVGPDVRPAWKTKLDGKLTQPVAAGGLLFVARVDAGEVCCLDAFNGKQAWRFVTGGRVDSAPTYYKGRLIFGSADGSVYCLRATDGVLAWRFRAAPAERFIVSAGQVESAWPVHGSVLLMNDTIYFTAGRSSFLDGGIFIYGLDPLTGEKRYENKLTGPELDTKTLDENAYAMEGAKSDLLVSDGSLLYLFHNAFNTCLDRQPTPVLGEMGVRNLGERKFGEHLFTNAGFLDDSWFSRNQWMLGDHWTAFNFAHQAPKEGELLVFDEKHTYAVKAFVRRNVLSPLAFPATDGYFVVADANSTRPVLVNPRQQSKWLQWLPQEGQIQKCWNLDVGFARGEPPKWTTTVPVRIRAMVRTANALFAAGPPDVCDPAALEGRKGAVLLAFNPDDGKKVFESNLDAPPVFDGMMAANHRLYIATTDGNVLCFAGK